MTFQAQAKNGTDKEVAQMLEHSSIIARACALIEIGSRLEKKFDGELFNLLVSSVRDGKNRTKYVKGTISVAHIGMSAISKINQFQSNEVFLNLLREFKDDDLVDLKWFLQDEGVKHRLKNTDADDSSTSPSKNATHYFMDGVLS